MSEKTEKIVNDINKRLNTLVSQMGSERAAEVSKVFAWLQSRLSISSETARRDADGIRATFSFDTAPDSPVLPLHTHILPQPVTRSFELRPEAAPLMPDGSPKLPRAVIPGMVKNAPSIGEVGFIDDDDPDAGRLL